MLKAGMFARVLLTTTAESEVPALPLSALREDAGQTYVWVLANGKLARRMVDTGLRDGRAQRVEIRSGLAPSEAALATKFDNLKDGLAARVVDTGSKVTAAGAVVPAAPARQPN
jgi:multidrug efflux pump subunit AcrA (membrane-fusion protein)